MFACCGRPAAASFCDPFTYIVSTMRVKGSQKSARWGPPSRRRPLVRQAPGAPQRDPQVSQRGLFETLDEVGCKLIQLIEGLPVVRGGGQLPAIGHAFQRQCGPRKNRI